MEFYHMKNKKERKKERKLEKQATSVVTLAMLKSAKG